jgi:hypothetical protein
MCKLGTKNVINSYIILFPYLMLLIFLSLIYFGILENQMVLTHFKKKKLSRGLNFEENFSYSFIEKRSRLQEHQALTS